ncbi:NUDIX domain-containing protein [Glaciecola sp. 1036]|uniref:NUDIX domain-containing protein n=1 Tax=Alteromonadaceae TaxID=72275 RepID=UPI003D03FB81
MQELGKDDVKVINKESLHTGFFKTNLYHVQHKKFDGSWTPVFTREVFERGHAVAVLPYDPELEEFVLIEQFRFPAMETAKTPWQLEVVAGIIEPNESYEEVIHREAKEEANLVLDKVFEIPSFLVSPGGTTERIYAYIGKVDASNAGGVHGLDEETEDIRVHRVSEAVAKEWLLSGKLENATAIILLQWFFLNKQNILDAWAS